MQKDFTDFDRNFMEYGGCGCGGGSSCTCGAGREDEMSSFSGGCTSCGDSGYSDFSGRIDPTLTGQAREEALAELALAEAAWTAEQRGSESGMPLDEKVLLDSGSGSGFTRTNGIPAKTKKILIIAAAAIAGFVIYKKYIKK